MTDATRPQPTPEAATFAANVATMIDNTLAELEAESRAADDLYTTKCRDYCTAAFAKPPADAATIAALMTAANDAKFVAENITIRNDYDRFAALVMRLPAWVAEISAHFPAVSRGFAVTKEIDRCHIDSPAWNELTPGDLAYVNLKVMYPYWTAEKFIAYGDKPNGNGKRTAETIAAESVDATAAKKPRPAAIKKPAAKKPVMIPITIDDTIYFIDGATSSDAVYTKGKNSAGKATYTHVGNLDDDGELILLDDSDLSDDDLD